MNKIEKKWYMITTVSGKEEIVIESLKNRIVSENVESNFDLKNGFKVMLVPHIAPHELEKRKLKQPWKVKKRNLFKGYIFVLMNMTNEAWFVVRNTQYVTGLVGSSGQRAKPSPISSLQIQKMEMQVAKFTAEFEQGKIQSNFEVEQIVEVTSGPAKGQVGAIIEKNDEREVAIVELILFERKTPTEIAYENLKIKR